MSENKKNQEQKAKEFFADKKNSNINTVYTTSDGWLFRAAHYANNWVKDNPKVTIEVHQRNSSKGLAKIIEEITAGMKSDQVSDVDADSTSSGREALIKEYIELFDTKPHHMFGDEKIARLIEEKKAELANAGGDEDDQNKDGSSEEPDADQSDKGDGADKQENE